MPPFHRYCPDSTYVAAISWEGLFFEFVDELGAVMHGSPELQITETDFGAGRLMPIVVMNPSAATLAASPIMATNSG